MFVVIRTAARCTLIAALLITLSFAARAQDLRHAESLYLRTEYAASLQVLAGMPLRDAPAWFLLGKNHYMLGDYKQAAEAFENALALQPDNSNFNLWTGRAYGRRAETSNPLSAPLHANKARQYFERSVDLDPRNQEALNDLLDYYLQAPGFLGGGFEKAEALARKIAQVNPAEYDFAQAQIADKRKQYDRAEEHLRRAIAQAPRQVGRVLDLAKYLARQGRYPESDAAFQQADQIAPDSPKVMFAKARTYIGGRRKLDEARTLLQRYLQSNLTPDDPPRAEARRLLNQVLSGA